MDHETLFRMILAVLALALYLNHLAYGKSFPGTKTIGGVGEISLIVAACLWTLSLFAYSSGFWWQDLQVTLPQWIRWIGVSLMTLCLPLSAWIYQALGIHFSTKLQLLEDHRLVSNGPYRWVRHPMYATFFLCALATSLISSNLIVMATGIAVCVMMALRIKKEEAMLQERFGESYHQYQKGTGALIPKLPLLS